MKKLLKEIVEINAGYSFRGTIPVSENGNHRVIQIKDVTYSGFISSRGLIKATTDSIKPQYLTQTGDVLFTSRGTNRRAAVVDETATGAIFVSQLYALKTKTDAVMPEYLAWYLNQKPAQEFFEANASGSYIQNIRHDVLAQLPVILPSVEMQKRIVEIYRLGLREREIAEKILEKRWQTVEKTLLELIKEK
ncbi:MAG: restriction endonuclease subunit S [Acidobacteria bacterium]|jgi:restriction endonuclease S subunit|nr:restriction endonuclease subunit S [Acidobacteriota bacterium]